MSQFSSFGFTEGLEGIGTLKERLVEVTTDSNLGFSAAFVRCPVLTAHLEWTFYTCNVK